MLRLIFLFIIGVLIVIAGSAVALFHFFGWKGLIAFPFVLIAIAWLVKVLVKTVFKRFLLGLFGMKSRVLRGATMNVHSIRSVPKPPDPEPEPDEEEEEEAVAAIEDQSESDEDSEADESDSDEEDEDEEAETEPGTPKDYVEVDLTITPKAKSGDSVWEPSELMLLSTKIKSLEDMGNNEVGSTHSVEVWNGTEFGPDDPGKYPGEQRLKITFAVKAGASHGWLHYYNEPIGELKLPVGTIDV